MAPTSSINLWTNGTAKKPIRVALRPFYCDHIPFFRALSCTNDSYETVPSFILRIVAAMKASWAEENIAFSILVII